MTHSPPNKCGDIAGTSCDSNDLDGPVHGSINDKVRANGPEQHRIFRQIFAGVSYAGRTAERFKRVEQLAYPPVGGVNVIRGDVAPDLIKIAVGIDAEDITC